MSHLWVTCESCQVDLWENLWVYQLMDLGHSFWQILEDLSIDFTSQVLVTGACKYIYNSTGSYPDCMNSAWFWQWKLSHETLPHPECHHWIWTKHDQCMIIDSTLPLMITSPQATHLLSVSACKHPKTHEKVWSTRPCMWLVTMVWCISALSMLLLAPPSSAFYQQCLSTSASFLLL